MDAPTGLILCGGEGRRLGGIDKPLRSLAGRPLVMQVIARLQPQVGRWLICANRTVDRYAALGGAVIGDGPYAGRGPLAGLLAGLAASDGEVLCVPGDAPALPIDLATRLATGRGRAAIAYVHDGDGPQALCALLPSSLHQDLRAYLDAGGDTPRDWFAQHAAVAIDFSDVPRWAWSLNTDAEWAAAERRLADDAPALASGGRLPVYPDL